MRLLPRLLLIALCVAPFACQTEVQRPNHGVVHRSAVRQETANVPGAPPPQSVSPDQLFSTDPSAMRLHDISGAMLYYFALNKRLPDTLEELRPFADDSSAFDVTNPYDHQPYGYAPRGLAVEGRPKRIVAYDPSPRDGRRWCILMIVNKPGASQSVEVLSLPEGIFRTYQPAADR